MFVHAKKLLTPAGWREDRVVEVVNGRVAAVTQGTQGELHADILAPGLFDVHCHGGEGFYTLHPHWDRLTRYLTRLAECGVTDLLLSPSTCGSTEVYRASMDFIREAMRRQREGELGGAVIQGVHLEGPFLSPRRPGAMDKDAMPLPSVEAYDALFGADDDIVKLVTLAPEQPGAEALTRSLISRGIKVQAGHTDATTEQAAEGFGWGIDSLCHTFNAARPIHHRDPGVVTQALLNDGVFCEAICDFKHLHPDAVRLIYRMKGPERMVMISDSVTVTGMADGEHEIDGHKYLIVNGTQRVNGGETLSGGACFLNGGVKNLADIGIPPEHALRMASHTPALRLGMEGSIGAILPGRAAHMAAFHSDMSAAFSIIGDHVYSEVK